MVIANEIVGVQSATGLLVKSHIKSSYADPTDGNEVGEEVHHPRLRRHTPCNA